MVCNKIYLVAMIAGLSGTVSVYGVVNSTAVEAVRNRTHESRSALSSADEAVVDTFIRNGLTQMFMEDDAWRAVDVREAILAQRGGATPSPYSTVFANMMVKHLRPAFEDATRLQDPGRRRRLRLNLIILAAGLQAPEMIPFGLEKADDSDPTVQYWAVKTVTNPVVAAQLTSQALGDEELTRRVLNRLDQVVNESILPETLRMIVEFADRINTPEARVLVNKVADLRTRQYADWTVRYELLDAMVLSALGKQIQAETSDARRADLLRRFAQLYSYVIERYILGEGLLNDVQRQHVLSVIAETENGAITEILNRPQNRLRKAIEGGKGPAVEAERQILLGGPDQPGQLATRHNYDYGKAAGGAAITEPLRLKAPGPAR